jgi:hypothetical protein
MQVKSPKSGGAACFSGRALLTLGPVRPRGESRTIEIERFVPAGQVVRPQLVLFLSSRWRDRFILAMTTNAAEGGTLWMFLVCMILALLIASTTPR